MGTIELLQRVNVTEDIRRGAPPTPDPDAGLVAQFREGSAAAFDALVERHRLRIFHLACRLVGTDHADDVAQEVFIAAYRALHHFRGEARFSTWLYRIALHTCSRRLKTITARSRREHHPSPAAEDAPDESLEIPDSRHDPERLALRTELREEVRRAIAGLSEKHRDVIVLRDLQQLSYEEIAEVIGCPVGTVRSRLHHATAQLAERLRPYVQG